MKAGAGSYCFLEDGSARNKASALLASEAEKFELWAVNLGLFVAVHGSLDYHLREAGRLSETIRRFGLITELLESQEEMVFMNDPFIPRRMKPMQRA